MNENKTLSFGTPKRKNFNSSSFYSSRLYTTMEKKTLREVDKKIVENKLDPSLIDRIYCHSSEVMSELPDNSVHLIVTSPPYNVQKEYDKDLSLSEYLSLLRTVFRECYRVLVAGGRACINIANIGRRPYIPLSSYVTSLMEEVGFLMRGEVIWDKGAVNNGSCAWGSWCSASNPILRDGHEYILIFSKLDYKRVISKEDKDKKVSTISKDEFISWTRSIWNMAPVSAKRIGHPAPFPEELPHRLINLYTFKEDIVLDPFIGSGTSAISALKNARHFIGYEVEPSYIKIAKARIQNAKVKVGTLPF